MRYTIELSSSRIWLPELLVKVAEQLFKVSVLALEGGNVKIQKDRTGRQGNLLPELSYKKRFSSVAQQVGTESLSMTGG